MKTEHEQLKYICDKIWYEYDINKEVVWTDYMWYPIDVNIKLNAREIIFNQEFMDKFTGYICKDLDNEECSIDAWNKWEKIIYHLDNPTLYIYNLLWLWTNKKW